MQVNRGQCSSVTDVLRYLIWCSADKGRSLRANDKNSLLTSWNDVYRVWSRMKILPLISDFGFVFHTCPLSVTNNFQIMIRRRRSCKTAHRPARVNMPLCSLPALGVYETHPGCVRTCTRTIYRLFL